MNALTLAIVIHNHQPRGNWNHIFRKACDRCYGPFLTLLEENRWFACGLHYSGCLLEWMDENRPEIPERLKALVQRGQVEIVGGGFYEPIFTMLPERDRREQLESFSRYLADRFGQAVSGAWVPERVWEQNLATTLADCGIRYTVLDDAHFRAMGLRAPNIRGYYLTEDQGRLLRVFAGDENLRYWIPFAEPDRTIGYLAGFAREAQNAVICYGDDGEKFGVWPQTYEHCYGGKWLERFFAALKASGEWLHLKRPGDVIAGMPPAGKVYLPDSSYREMTEWSLPTEALAEYEELWEKVRHTEWADRIRPFLRGGTWRNFKAKYVAAARMYARMMEASELAERVPARAKAKADAVRLLYQGQCNCAYWHGVFGGLYLPHLRRAVYADLIRSTAASEAGLKGLPPAERRDFDLDGVDEVKLNSRALAAYLKPAQGGRCYELDLKAPALNLLDTVQRQREAYHRKVVDHAGRSTGGVETIHELLRFKQPGLEKRLVYDRTPRDSAIDHIVPMEGAATDAGKGQVPELADFVEGAYEVVSRAGARAPSVLMRRDGALQGGGAGRLRITKRVSLHDEPPALTVEYALSPLNGTAMKGVRFAVEFNVAMSDEEGGNQRFYLAGDEPAGRLDETASFDLQKGVRLADDWLALEVGFRLSQPGTVWLFPIQTVNQSESGFELNYQGTCVHFVWPLELEPGAVWRCTVTQTANVYGRPPAE